MIFQLIKVKTFFPGPCAAEFIIPILVMLAHFQVFANGVIQIPQLFWLKKDQLPVQLMHSFKLILEILKPDWPIAELEEKYYSVSLHRYICLQSMLGYVTLW